MSEKALREALDLTVERVIKKLDRKTLVEGLPQAIEREYLSEMHQRLQDLIRTKLHQSIEELLENYKMCEKLASLDKRVLETRQSRKHEAWRPSDLGVKQSTAAHDLKILTEEKKELEALLLQLDTEVEKLEKEVLDSETVMTANMEIIKKREDLLKNVSNKMSDV